jgi:amidase
MRELTFMSATALAAAIRAREVSVVDVIDAHLARIAAVNPRLNAVVQLDTERALTEARAADMALARGEILGPLHGVPFTVKDVIETEALICAAGLPERAAFVPAEDATVVARLRDAGAILLGKTNVPSGGGGIECDNALYGRTNNPYDLTRTPGGSSGGEAATIAAGGSPLGLGSDSGGSVRFPAHNCGVAGLKPTTGRVPATGAGHVGDVSDVRTVVGLLAREVQDLALAFPLIAGVDWRDASVVPMPLSDPAAVEMKHLRVAFYTDDGVSVPTPETAAAVRAAARALADAGATVEEQAPPRIAECWEITQGVWRWHRGESTATEYARVLHRWGRLRSRLLGFMEQRDLVLCPVAATPAVRHGDTADYMQATLISYTILNSLTGWPAVAVRASTSPEGLPIGVQVVARPWREDVALAAALHLDTVLGGWQPPPL